MAGPWRPRAALVAGLLGWLAACGAPPAPAAVADAKGGARPAAGPAAPGPAAACALPPLAPGDIVMLGADGSFWARAAALYSRPERRFGHVGIAVEAAHGAILIVHAKGSPTAKEAVVTAEPLAVFLHGASRAGLYRARAGDISAALAAYAAQAVGAPFDAEFRLDDHGAALYCTELVWLALQEALGVPLAPERVLDRDAITLRWIETRTELTEVAFDPQC